MKQQKSALWWLLLAVSLLCSGILLVQRFTAEEASDRASAIMELADAEMLAEANGMELERCLHQLQASGVRGFVWEEDGILRFEEGDGFLYLSPPDMDYPPQPLVLVENHDRTAMILPEGFDLNGYRGLTMKALYLYEDYANRATETDAKEIENLLFRAVTDRGLRLLMLEPFTTGEGEVITDLSVYTDCLEQLEARLESRGIDFGEGSSSLETRPLNHFLLAGAGILPVLLGAWLVCRWEKLRRFELPLEIIGTLGVVGLSLVLPFLAQKLLMLASAVLFPCVGAWHLAMAAKREPPLLAQRPGPAAWVLGSGLVFLWALLGGLHVAALMSSRVYLLGHAIFSGVKIALLGPMALAGVLLVWVLWERLRSMSVKGWLAAGVLFLVLCGGGYLFVVRSGDLVGGASGLETALRNWLEETFYARPRSKELFLAAPCVPLFFWAARRRVTLLTGLFGMGAALECVSVCNTFCHGVAPLTVSLVRSLLGMGLGLLAGLVLAGLLELGSRSLEARASHRN